MSSALAATPVFTPVAGSPFATGASGSLAFSPSGRLLAIVGFNSVSVFEVNSSTGALTLVGSPVATGSLAVSVAFSPSGRLLAVANHGDGTVSLFSVSSAGALRPVLGSPVAIDTPSNGLGPWSMGFSPSGGLLAVGSFAGTVSVFSVNSAGALKPVSRSPIAIGEGRPSVAFSPSGLLAVAGGSLGTPAAISLYSVNSAGALTPDGTVPDSVIPQSLAFSPSGGLLAVANEGLAPAGGVVSNGTVSVFSVNSSAETELGTPITIDPGDSAFSPSLPGALAFSPSGGLLAVNDENAQSVSVFSVSSAGALTQLSSLPVRTADNPEPMAFSPSGGLLAVSDANAQSVAVFSISYPNAAAPSAQITSPASGATYTSGQPVHASFGCLEGAGGPGLASCAGTVPNGTLIDNAVGPHRFTVTVTSNDGQHATSTVTYTVEPSAITVSHVKAQADGTIRFQVYVRGPGAIDVLQTAWDDNLAHTASVLQPAAHRFAVGRAHTDATHAGVLHLQVSDNAEGKRLMQHHRYAVVLRLWVTYTPTGGTPSSVGFYGVHPGSGCPGVEVASSAERAKIDCAA